MIRDKSKEEKIKRKRVNSFIPVFLALLMLLLSACNGKKPPEETPATSEELTDQTDPMELVPKEDYNIVGHAVSM